MTIELLAEHIRLAASDWFRSEEAQHAARLYESAYLKQYRRVLAVGADERTLAHCAGNARGRFYEYMTTVAASRAVLAAADGEREFVCAGGTGTLGGGALSRSERGDVVVNSPSFLGGPQVSRAEFDGLIWDHRKGLAMVELTASSKNVGDLVVDLWRKQLVAMRIFEIGSPPPVLLISPHALPFVQQRVANLILCGVPFPEELWALAVDRRRPWKGTPAAPTESVGPTLRGARSPEYPTMLEAVADDLVRHIQSSGNLHTFCADHRDSIAMARRIYLGCVNDSARADLAELVTRLHGKHRRHGPDPAKEIAAGRATVHLSVKFEAYHRPLLANLHVVTRTTGKPGEYRLDGGGRGEWVTAFHRAEAFRSELRPGARRLDVGMVTATISACTRSKVLEPSIRRGADRQQAGAHAV